MDYNQTLSVSQTVGIFNKVQMCARNIMQVWHVESTGDVFLDLFSFIPKAIHAAGDQICLISTQPPPQTPLDPTALPAGSGPTGRWTHVAHSCNDPPSCRPGSMAGACVPDPGMLLSQVTQEQTNIFKKSLYPTSSEPHNLCSHFI